MGTITWLASYPKSGNTWLRILLTNYLRDGGTPTDINKLDGGPIASARAWFDEWVGVEASALDDTLVERLRPDVYRCLARDTTDALYMKAHDAWGRTDTGEPLFPADVTAGVIYVLRSPLDLAASCAHHFGVDLAAAVEDLCDPAFTLGRSASDGTDQLRQRLGSWTGHVCSWLDESGLSVHLVRYEDLHHCPEVVFGRVVRFCGLPWDERRIRKAVAFSAFTELQCQERAAGFRERSVFAHGPFFRRGEVGSWREELSPSLVRRLIETHGAAMRRFRYLDEHGQPV